MNSSALRGIVRDGKVEVDLPDGTEVLILPESAATPLAPEELAQIIATMPPFVWTAEDEAEWQAEKAKRAE